MLSAVIRGPAGYVNRESTTDQSGTGRVNTFATIVEHRPGVSNTSELLGRPAPASQRRAEG